MISHTKPFQAFLPSIYDRRPGYEASSGLPLTLLTVYYKHHKIAHVSFVGLGMRLHGYS